MSVSVVLGTSLSFTPFPYTHDELESIRLHKPLETHTSYLVVFVDKRGLSKTLNYHLLWRPSSFSSPSPVP